MADRYKELVRETTGHYIGPMPIEIFLDDFLPWNPDTPENYKAAEIPASRINMLKSMAGAAEAKSCQKFVDAFSEWPSNAAAIAGADNSYIKCPISFHDTHSKRDPSCGKMGMDITVYDEERADRIPTASDFSKSEGFVELKPKENYDAFIDEPRQSLAAQARANATDPGASAVSEGGDDASVQPSNGTPAPTESEIPTPTPSYPFENASSKGVETRGQLAAYNAVIMGVQYRSHVFSTLVCGTFVRFMRWDRSSAIVTRRFDYTQKPEILFRFYQRLAQLTDRQRGVDPTVTLPTEEEDKTARGKFVDYASELWYGQTESFHNEQGKISELSLLKMTFAGDAYIIPAPVYHEGFLSPFGRSTRRGIVMRVSDNRVLYLKDYWREDSALTLKESEIYERLALHNVENVAEMAAGGDVDGMQTIGHQYAGAAWVHWITPLRIRALHAHRILLLTLGRDLLTFPTAKSLVKCVADGMKGHQMAYEKARILHRDISVGNIMMKIRPTDDSPIAGFLIDWDHCVVLDLIPPGGLLQRRILRTGTWQFISANLVENPRAEHTVLDDRESALFVLAYAALRHLEHDLSLMKLNDLLEVFDVYFYQEGHLDEGGSRKRTAIIAGSFANVNFSIPEMHELFAELCSTFAIRYTNPPSKSTARRRRNAEREELERQLEEVKYNNGLARLNDDSWLHTTLSDIADDMPERGKDEFDRVDNTIQTKITVKPSNKLKRTGELTSADCNYALIRVIKKSKGFDGQAVQQVTSDCMN
ncbi:hypothetical protein CPB85DRAFT_881631 [Mucidula mucida]|nr:hypothetical protein CPB85DRAFT_881631 [Mucidula mucida]